MTTAIILAAGAAIIVIAIILFAAYDCFFNKPVCTEDIPHVPKPPLPKPQPLKRLPAKVTALGSGGSILRACTETEPIELRKQYITTGAVAVYIALKPGGDGIEIAYFDDEDPEFNSLQADELIETMTRAKSDYLLTTVRNK